MRIVDTIRSLVEGEEEAITFRYKCRSCSRVFEDTEQSTSDLTCPECGTAEKRDFARL